MKIVALAATLAAATTAVAAPTITPPAPTVKAKVVTAVPPAKTPIVVAAAKVVHHRKTHRSAAESCVQSANRRATLEPAANAYINAVQIYPYSDGAVFHVFTAPGQVTDIALQPGEVLGAVAAGDTVRWIIGDTTSGNGDGKLTHVLVKPFTAGLATNVIITTDRRAYHLSLTSSDHTAMVALSWTYPQDQLIALKAKVDLVRAVEPVASGLQIEQLHFDYTISGDDPPWRPLRAFDDGRQTFIEFPASLATGEAPPLFLIDGKGTASLVNYRLQGLFYVVDRLFASAELRLGLKHQEVVRISHLAGRDNRRRAS